VLSMECCLTFELRRAVRQARVAVRRRIDKVRPVAKRACRSASAIERGVRPHLAVCLAPTHARAR
jgi:hypothetical protein